jgi:hypothetical protein
VMREASVRRETVEAALIRLTAASVALRLRCPPCAGVGHRRRL